MTINMMLQVTCDYCDTQLLIPIRAAVTLEETVAQLRQHDWTGNADGKIMRHLCPLCVEVLDDSPPVGDDIPW